MKLYDKILLAGLALFLLGFAAAWTDRTFGLTQVLLPDQFEALGGWLMRVGATLAVLGSVVHVIVQIT